MREWSYDVLAPPIPKQLRGESAKLSLSIPGIPLSLPDTSRAPLGDLATGLLTYFFVSGILAFENDRMNQIRNFGLSHC